MMRMCRGLGGWSLTFGWLVAMGGGFLRWVIGFVALFDGLDGDGPYYGVCSLNGEVWDLLGGLVSGVKSLTGLLSHRSTGPPGAAN